MTCNSAQTVAEIMSQVPGAAQVFDRAGIDFCCGGTKSLRDACQARGIAVDEILGALEFNAGQPAATKDAMQWKSAPLVALTAHIVKQHHQYVRTEMPLIERWMDKCVAAHGERHPELLRIRHAFQAMARELSRHMAKEELILFPAITRLEAPSSEGGRAEDCFESLERPVRMMILEHQHTGSDLQEIRQASGDYAPPPDACATYRALYRALEEFDADMRLHVHLENNILFPRALELEKTRHCAG